MEKQRLTKVALWATALAPFLLTACVQDDYDLTKDIDMTITIGGNLNIPGSGTEEFTLADIMDLEENSVVKADANGDYALNKADTTETDVDIDPVHINDVTTEATTKVLSFSSAGTAGELAATVGEEFTMHFTFAKDDVTQDIVSLNSATVDFVADFVLGFNNSNNNINEITLKQGFEVEMEIEGQTAPDGFEFELMNTENYAISPNDPQTIVFLSDQRIRRGDPLRIPIHFTGIRNIPKGQGLYERGYFRLQTNIIPRGTATTPAVASGDAQVTLVNDADVPGFTLMSVTGVIDPEIDINVDPITVSGIPDILKDDVNLDLTNPYIRLRLENGSPADVNLQAHITWTKDGVQADGFDIGTALGTDIPGQTIVLDDNAPSEYYLSRVRMDEIDQRHNIVLGDDLYELVRNIPDEIRLTEVNARALQNETTVELGADGAHYDVNTIYELNAPLRFGDQLNIVYKDTIDDWGSDLEDISIRKAVVEMTALNGIPLNFRVNAQAIDRNGNVYPNVTVNPVENTIRPGLKLQGDNGQTATESPIRLEIICESGEMPDLDGLIVNFSADMQDVDASQNATLNRGMTLRLTDIRIRIENGVTVDLN